MPRPTRILLVEDNLLDARATLRALDSLAHPHETEHFVHGSDALITLAKSAGTDSRPDLVLLDLNASGVRGLDVLQVIESDPALKQIPVAILSTSDNQADMDGAFRNGARAYFVKPRSVDGWSDIIGQLDALIADEAECSSTAEPRDQP